MVPKFLVVPSKVVNIFQITSALDTGHRLRGPKGQFCGMVFLSANEKLVAMSQQQKSAGGSADNQLIGSPAERRAFTSVSRRAGSRIVWVFSQEVIVKSGRADKKRSAVCFASSGWPFC